MNCDIEVRFQRIPGGVLTIFFRACAPIQCDTPLLELGEFEVRELCNALGDECRRAESASGMRATELLAARTRFVLVNGWQSWSFAGELAGGERPRRALLKRDLNLFSDHPAETALRRLARRFGHRRDHISHFMLGLRAGELRLVLVSDNVERLRREANGAATDFAAAQAGTTLAPQFVAPQPAATPLPPLSFLLRGNTVRVFAYAEGASFARGEVVARVAVLIAPDYFSLKDRLAAFWGAGTRFDDLRWFAAPMSGEEAAAVADGAPESANMAATSVSAPTTNPNIAKAAFSGVIGGYASWYNHYTKIDERIISEDLGAIRTNDNFVNACFIRCGEPAVFQIDDGWETAVGDWTPHKGKFPGGMAKMAERIRQQGLIPGIWLAPFLLMPNSATARAHPDWLLMDRRGSPVKAGWNPNWGGDVWCLDLSRPQVEDYLMQLFDTIVNSWGFRYLKLDFLYAGLLRGAFAGRKGGAWQHYNRIMARILEFARAKDGSPVAFLSCGAPIESTAPFMPLMRSGADTREHWDWPLLRLIGHQGRPSAKMNMRDSIGRALMDKTLLLNDPDVIFCRTDRTSLKDTEKFLVGMVATMFGSQLMSSDDPSGFGAGSPAPDRLSETDFTAQLIGWYLKLGSREFAVQRSARRSSEVFHFYSRDGSVYGGINLSNRMNYFMSARLPPSTDAEDSRDIEEESAGAKGVAEDADVAEASGAVPILPHSLLIFGA